MTVDKLKMIRRMERMIQSNAGADSVEVQKTKLEGVLKHFADRLQLEFTRLGSSKATLLEIDRWKQL